MVSSDTIVGIVGAVILTGAMVAVFYYEADREPTSGDDGIGTGSERFQFTFQENETVHVDGETGMLSEGAESTWNLGIPPYGYGIHVEVAWSHDLEDTPLANAGDISFQIEILDEDGNVVGSSGESTYHREMDDNRSMPPQMNLTVNADSEGQARSVMAEYMNSPEIQQNAREWTVRLTLQEDGLPEDDPTEQYPPWQYEVSVRSQHYSPLLVDSE